MCPETISCNYDLGTCFNGSEDLRHQHWLIHSNDIEQRASDEWFLAEITGYKTEPDLVFERTFQVLSCVYRNPNSKSQPSFYLLYQKVDHLNEGNWHFSGFGKDRAKCLSNNTSECTATK